MKKISTDVIVISAGTAGLPAAVAAAEGGADVTIFEKRGSTGGAGNRANAILGVGTRLQRLHGENLTPEEAYKIHMDWTHWRVDARLVSELYRKSASTMQWLEDMGVEFAGFQGGNVPQPGRRMTAHDIKGEPQGPRRLGHAATAMKILTKRAKELGVQFYMKTPVKKIRKRGGRIVGVMAQELNGQEIRADAKAVIIATGGFGGNNEMMKQYTGFDEGHTMFMLQKVGLTGDGIRMAWEVGAGKSEMNMGLTHHLPPPLNGPGGTSVEFQAFQRPTNIMVNLVGERFVNEDIGGSHAIVCNSISTQKGKTAFMIFNGEMKKYYDENPTQGFRGQSDKFIAHKHDDLDDNIREVQSTGYKYVFMADSLEELCAQTGIKLRGLLNTIDEYNHACEIGRDDIFYKNPELLMPFSKDRPKFYAGRYFPGAYNTVGGIKINYKTEVLTEDWEPIPGLYAAGADANALYGHTYVPLAGNHMAFAINTARMAAENALEYIKTISK